MAIPTIPRPDQIAYTIPTGSVFNDMDISQKAREYPVNTIREGISFESPSDAFKALVAMISAMTAKKRRRYGFMFPQSF